MTRIVGVVNVTPDSFSDGGQFMDPDRAAAHARTLLDDGAALVDVGAASSHPQADRVGPAEEIRRLEPVIDRLADVLDRVSIDSFEPDVQRYAISRGVRWLNDVHGFAAPDAYADLARARCGLVVMYARSPDDTAPQEGIQLAPAQQVDRVQGWLERRVRALTSAGVARDRIIVDPGMGLFLGPDPEASWIVLRHLRELRSRLALPVLVGVSRKSFLGTVTGRPPLERGAASLAAELHAAAQGVEYIRTHEVRPLRDALLVQEVVSGPRC